MIRAALRLALTLFTGALALAAGELGIRAYDAHVLGADGPDRETNPLYVLTDAPQRYQLRPGGRRYRGRIDSNAAGLRGPERPPEADPSEFRILFVGDSVTFAGELPYDLGFPAKVEAALRSSAIHRFA